MDMASVSIITLQQPNPYVTRAPGPDGIIAAAKTDRANQTNSQSQSSMNESLTHVVYAVDTTAHRIWLNVVDQQSGQVLFKLPPQAVRNILDALAHNNSFDRRS